MKTIGEVLRSRRKALKKTLRQVYKETKIQEKILQDLENNDFDLLPPETFIKGFIKIYAQNLNLNTEKTLAIFRRDWQKQKNQNFFPLNTKNILQKKGFYWTPKMTVFLLISALATFFLSYIGWQIREFFQPPKLIIEQPVDNKVINNKKVVVKGKTDKEASIYINNKLIDMNEEGYFSYSLKLFSGENIIEIKAVNRNGKETIVTRRLTVDNKP